MLMLTLSLSSITVKYVILYMTGLKRIPILWAVHSEEDLIQGIFATRIQKQSNALLYKMLFLSNLLVLHASYTGKLIVSKPLLFVIFNMMLFNR